jgi:hypothetical protein
MTRHRLRSMSISITSCAPTLLPAVDDKDKVNADGFSGVGVRDGARNWDDAAAEVNEEDEEDEEVDEEVEEEEEVEDGLEEDEVKASTDEADSVAAHG